MSHCVLCIKLATFHCISLCKLQYELYLHVAFLNSDNLTVEIVNLVQVYQLP